MNTRRHLLRVASSYVVFVIILCYRWLKYRYYRTTTVPHQFYRYITLLTVIFFTHINLLYIAIYRSFHYTEITMHQVLFSVYYKIRLVIEINQKNRQHLLCSLFVSITLRISISMFFSFFQFTWSGYKTELGTQLSCCVYIFLLVHNRAERKKIPLINFSSKSWFLIQRDNVPSALLPLGSVCMRNFNTVFIFR